MAVPIVRFLFSNFKYLIDRICEAPGKLLFVYVSVTSLSLSLSLFLFLLDNIACCFNNGEVCRHDSCYCNFERNWKENGLQLFKIEWRQEGEKSGQKKAGLRNGCTSIYNYGINPQLSINRTVLTTFRFFLKGSNNESSS
jgi:hypothetical protein